jgi:DNA-binding MarR family transcriptional regulator
MVRLDILIVSPLITELMMKGYVEIIRRRRLFFFSREYCTITVEGLAALEQAKNLFENIVELIRERALETIDNIAADSPLLKLTVMSAKAAYKTVKVLV